MKTPKTDRLVALQFLVVVLPVVVVLLAQMLADSRRAAAQTQSRPMHELAQHARVDYSIFMNGVSDAVDTGTLSDQAAHALASAAGPWSHYGTHLPRSARDQEVPRGPLAGRRPHIRLSRASTWQPIVRSIAQVLLTLPRDRAISSVVVGG